MGNRRAPAAQDDRMRRFKQELAKRADHLRVLPYVGHTQSELAADLKKVKRAAREALKVVHPLQIVDNPEPINFPLFQALLIGLNRSRAKKKLPPMNGTDFPASAVSALIDLQEAAESALVTNGPRRGNATGRTEKQARIARAAMDFVLQYNAIFDDWPPKSSTGPCVDAMRDFLERLGYKDEEADAADVLKRAVEKEVEAERAREAWSRTHL
jgi:L-fucose isomerase-like protein